MTNLILMASSLTRNATGLMVVLVLLFGISATISTAQTYTDLHDFNCSKEGCNPQFPAQLAQGRDGNLYGTMPKGGTFNFGTFFKATTGGIISVPYTFDGNNGNGRVPRSGVTLGTDGYLYGATLSGGKPQAQSSKSRQRERLALYTASQVRTALPVPRPGSLTAVVLMLLPFAGKMASTMESRQSALRIGLPPPGPSSLFVLHLCSSRSGRSLPWYKQWTETFMEPALQGMGRSSGSHLQEWRRSSTALFSPKGPLLSARSCRVRMEISMEQQQREDR